MNHRRHGGACDKQPDDAAGRSKQQVFDDELPQHASASGADGRAHGHFLAPCRRACELQARDVDARDRQDEEDAAEQNQQRAPRVSDEDVRERRHPQPRR